jgi:TetR/AcrR family transcriptional regulator, regulator of cefoperazone and chloramphenicol sensitivity
MGSPLRSAAPAAGTRSKPAIEERAQFPRGEEVRQRILAASIEEFAAEGFKGASTRSIAARAEVNIAALSYYFGGKSKLYRASVDYIVDWINQSLAPFAREARDALEHPDLSPEASRRALATYLANLSGSFLGGHGTGWKPSWSILLARTEFEPPEGDPWAFSSTVSIIMLPFCGLIARALARPPEDEECRAMALGMLGQVLVFRVTSSGQMPSMGWDHVDAARKALMQKVLVRNCLAMIDACAPPGARRRRPAPA